MGTLHWCGVATVLLALCVAVGVGEDKFVVITEGGELGEVDIDGIPSVTGVVTLPGTSFKGNPYVAPVGKPLLVVQPDAAALHRFDNPFLSAPFTESIQLNASEIACNAAVCVAVGSEHPYMIVSHDKTKNWHVPPIPGDDTLSGLNTVACGYMGCVAGGDNERLVVGVGGGGGGGWLPVFNVTDGGRTIHGSAIWETEGETHVVLVGDGGLLIYGLLDGFGNTHFEVFPTAPPDDLRAAHAFAHVNATDGVALVLTSNYGYVFLSLDGGLTFDTILIGTTHPVHQVHCQPNMVRCIAVGEMSGPTPKAEIFDKDGVIAGVLTGPWSSPIVGLRSLSSCGDGVLQGNERCEVSNDTYLWDPYLNGTNHPPPPPLNSSYPPPPHPNDTHHMIPYCPDYGVPCFFCDWGCTGAKFPGVIRVCGDGVHDPSHGEECDFGPDNSNTLPNACRTDCKNWRCGDGVVDVGEQCDTGPDRNDSAPNACRMNCVRAFCGDGVVDLGELCDDGPDNSDSAPDANCTSSCGLPRCGDGRLDTHEECDDGTLNNNNNLPDRCRENCLSAHCGDGVPDTGEDCDGTLVTPDGRNPNANCGAKCEWPKCGDGLIQPGEQCDDGDANGGLSLCTTNCTLPSCGDGIVSPSLGEECDTGTNNTFAPDVCRPNCRSPTCGDGIVDSSEECDDYVLSDTRPDACRSDCRYAHCGDGVKDDGEQCDFGYHANLRAPDHCRPNCESPRCGDGILDGGLGGEECDDGDGDNSDTLPNACRLDCKRAHCGDGVVDDGEDCDGGDCCSGNCTFVDSGTVCRTALGVCDVTETCTGWSATCPIDRFVPSGVVCHAYPSSPCRYDSYCSGSSYGCPNNYKAAGTICDDGDSCTGPFDTCNGVSSSCVSGSSNMCGCGDGVLDPLEECDDSNPNDGDGCSALCTLETGYYCDGTSCHVTTDCPDDSLIRDCNGDCGGTAYIDDCAVCTGGNTSLVPNYNKDECGVCYGGGGNKDSCGVCFGGDADRDACNVCFGDNSTCTGCDGVPNSGLVADVCGVCGGDGTSCLGCDGIPVPLGGKHYDSCWVCGGNSTACLAPCQGSHMPWVWPDLYDCNGDCDGTAFRDRCGACVGGATGIPPFAHTATCDNNTVCPPGQVPDVCGVCGGAGFSCLGCDSVPFSGKVVDVCGVCGGDGSSCEIGCDGSSGSGMVTDCNGDCGGSAFLDTCGMCVGGNTSRVADALIDDCGVCFGGNSGKDDCGDCNGGNAAKDSCGVCGGNDTRVDSCGVCFGAGVVDACGECNGNLTCLGCDSIPNSNTEIDSCGVCGGNCASGAVTGDSGKAKKVDEKTAVVAMSTVVVSSGLFVVLLVIGVLVLLRIRRRQAVHAFTEQLAADTLDAAPTGYIAMVFTDVENSTQLWEQFPTRMEAALDSHNSIVRSVMARTRGYEVKTEGDAFMIVFQDTADAVDFCCEAQLELLRMSVPEGMDTHPSCKTEASGRGTHRPLHDKLDDSSVGLFDSSVHSVDSLDSSSDSSRVKFLWRGFRVRMGIHYGDVLSEMSARTQRADYYGPNVNLAARVACTAYGGQVVMSEAALKQVRSHISASKRLVLESLGEVELKGITTPVPIHQVLPVELSARVWQGENGRGCRGG